MIYFCFYLEFCLLFKIFWTRKSLIRYMIIPAIFVSSYLNWMTALLRQRASFFFKKWNEHFSDYIYSIQQVFFSFSDLFKSIYVRLVLCLRIYVKRSWGFHWNEQMYCNKLNRESSILIIWNKRLLILILTVHAPLSPALD